MKNREGSNFEKIGGQERKRLEKDLGGEIPGIEETEDFSSQEELELSPEEIEVREKIREKEASFVSKILTNEIVSNGLDMVPFAGGGKMLVETAYGKTLSGKELKGKHRVIHGVAGSASVLADFSGGGAFIPITGRTTLWMEKAAAKMNANGVIKAARIFEAAAQFLKRHPELARLAEKSIEGALNNYVKEHRNLPQNKIT